MRLEENIDLGRTVPDVPVSIVKRDSMILAEGNPCIKPPIRGTYEERDMISLLELENCEICTREKTPEIKNGIQRLRVRSRLPLITHYSSISDRCPSIIVNSIDRNNDDEVKPVLDALNVNQMNNLSSSQQSISLDETELTQDSPNPNSATDNSKIS